MDYLRVKNWDTFQQYKDRDPKWIKVYRDLLDDYEIDRLSEKNQLHLIKIWLLAAKLDNKIPNDPAWVARKINAKSKVDLKQLVTAGFLCPYNPVQNCTETYLETEAYKEETYKEETEQDLSILADDDTPTFDGFWQAYPRKTAKKAAAKAWAKLKPDKATAEAIMADVIKRKTNDRDWTRDHGAFIPHPASYLNGERWTDQITTTGKQTHDNRLDIEAWRDRRLAEIADARVSRANGASDDRPIPAF